MSPPTSSTEPDESRPELSDLIEEARQAQDDATTLADEAKARIEETRSVARKHA